MVHRYTTVPELTVRGLHNVANAYSEHAKVRLSAAAILHVD